MPTKKDFLVVALLGALIGVLAQPILANFISRFSVSPFELRVGAFLFFLIGAVVALWIAGLIGKFVPVVYQFAKFAAVGGLNTFVDLGVFNLETLLLGHTPSGLTFAVLKTISFAVATLNSFYWNKYWTFGFSGRTSTSQGIRFYAVSIFGWLLNVGVATIVFKMNPSSALWLNVISPLAGTAIGLLWNFVGYKFFVFKRA